MSRVYDKAISIAREIEGIKVEMEDISKEIARWKQGKAQDYYELYNLPAEYGGGISALRDWVLEYNGNKLIRLEQEIESKKVAFEEMVTGDE